MSLLTILMWVAIALVVFLASLMLLLWQPILPLLLLWTRPIPVEDKRKGTKCILEAAFKGLLMVLPDLLAFVVVPIALKFTKWEDDKLPKLFRIWDNDVSINGDRAEYWPLDYDGITYYADAHPRSNEARYIWLAKRNRASWLSQKLGHTWVDRSIASHYGDPKTGRDHEGWVVNIAEDGLYQMYWIKKIGKMCIRVNYGYKIWTEYDKRPVANVVSIGFTILRWTGV